jgi:hypothetical protein
MRQSTRVSVAYDEGLALARPLGGTRCEERWPLARVLAAPDPDGIAENLCAPRRVSSLGRMIPAFVMPLASPAV